MSIDSTRSTLSVVILTFNNESYIEKLISSAAWANEIVIVDSGSTDATCEIARKAHKNCKVLQRRLDSFANQRNFGADNAAGEWILHCDSDEYLSEALQDELKSLLNGTPEFGAYRGRHKHYWLEQRLPFIDGPKGFGVTLHRRGAARFTGAIHEKMECDLPSGMLDGPFVHVCYDTMQERIDKLVRYAKSEAAMLAEKQPGEARRFASFVLWKPLKRFLGWAFVKRGAMSGHRALVYILLSVWGMFVARAMAWDDVRKARK